MSTKGKPRKRNKRKPENGSLYFNPHGTCAYCRNPDVAVSFHMGRWKCGTCFNKIQKETPYRGIELDLFKGNKHV